MQRVVAVVLWNALSLLLLELSEGLAAAYISTSAESNEPAERMPPAAFASHATASARVECSDWADSGLRLGRRR